jgi:hypothetical protein
MRQEFWRQLFWLYENWLANITVVETATDAVPLGNRDCSSRSFHKIHTGLVTYIGTYGASTTALSSLMIYVHSCNLTHLDFLLKKVYLHSVCPICFFNKEVRSIRRINANNLNKHSVRTSQETRHISATEPNRLMLFGETVAVYCENHTEHTDTLCGQNAEFWYVKEYGIYSNHWALNN